MTARDDLLIVDDLVLPLMDDDGASIQGDGTLYYTLGGAVLTELALLGRVDTGDSGVLNGPRVTPSGEGPLSDPLLQWAYDTVAEKTQRVEPLWSPSVPTCGEWSATGSPTVASSVVRSDECSAYSAAHDYRRPTKRTRHSCEPGSVGVLEDGEAPDPRTAAIIGLLSASGAMPSLRPPLAWTSATVTRAKQLESGQWGPEAVVTAVTRIAAAVVAAGLGERQPARTSSNDRGVPFPARA